MSKIYVDEILPKTSGSWPVMPDRPAWRLTGVHQDLTASGTFSAKWQGENDAVSADNRRFLLGGCTLSGDRIHITVPQTGLYQINFGVRVDELASTYVIARLMVNDSTTNASYGIIGNYVSTNYDNIALSNVMYIRENDTVSVEVYSSADTSWEIEPASHFSGVFIG